MKLVKQFSFVVLSVAALASLVAGQGAAVQNHGIAVGMSPVSPCTMSQDATVVLDRPENNSSYDLCPSDQVVIQLGVTATDQVGSDFSILGSGVANVEISSDGTAWNAVGTGVTLPAVIDTNNIIPAFEYVRITGDPGAAAMMPAASIDAVLIATYMPGDLGGTPRTYVDVVDGYTPSSSGTATFISSAEALGYPNAMGWDETSVWNGVVSMGQGAVLEVSSSTLATEDGMGADIIVYEHEGDEDQFTVEASQDGMNWFPMTTLGDQSSLIGTGASAVNSAIGFDLNGQIPWARYFRITSTSSDTAGLSPGPEIDGVELVNVMAEYQVNRAGSSLDIDGQMSSPWQIMSASNPQGTINIQGLQGMPYEFATTSPEAAITSTTGAQVVSDGQIINLDQAAPSFFMNNGGSFTVPFPGNGAIPYSTLGVNSAVTAQMAVVDPSEMVGYAFSAPIRLDPATTSNSITLTLGDDNAAEIPVISSAYPNLSFCGTNYDSFFVNANGSVTFSGADANGTPTAMLFESGLPRLAGLWTDLDPSAGGTVVVSSAGSVITVAFTNVPEAAVGATSTTSSFNMEFDLAAGSCSISGFSPDAGLTTPTLVGLSCGTVGGATNNGAQSFSSQVAGGPQTPTAVTDVIYEFVPSGVPTGFSSISFANSDPSTWTVN